MAYKERMEFVRPISPLERKLVELEERIAKIEDKKEIDPVMLFGMLKGYEERIEAIEHSLSPLNEGEELEPTKTIELTEEEIEWLQGHLQRQLRIMNSPPGDTLDRVNQRRIDDILYKLNKLDGK